MNPSTPPVLNLDAELRQLEVTYHGSTYELRSRAEFSILELHELSTLLHQYDDLTNVEDGDSENATKIGEALQQIVAMIVKGALPEGGFSDQLCAAILSFWTEQHQEADGSPPTRRPAGRAPQDRLPKKPRRSTGAK